MTTPQRNGGKSKSHVQVVIRSRPVLPQESQNKTFESVLDLNEPEGQVIVALEKTFAFDACFNSDTTQENIYQNVASNTVERFVRNLDANATIFAYGQTGSGKTYTMLGTENDPGIIPRAIQQIFQFCTPDDSIGISFYEIHNEKAFDLLSPSELKVPLKIGETAGEFYLPQLKQHWPDSESDAKFLLEQGLKTRSIGSTAQNATSSRSHAIFRISISRMNENMERFEAKLNLVDLAGSEGVKKTHAIGDRLAEANNINKGLLALGCCISGICAGKSHIPFRSSTLTKVLRECLHGNGYTNMVACVSPTESDLTETLNTLRYANSAKNMKKPSIPRHLLAFSARKRKFEGLDLPKTPGKFLKLNNTLGPITPIRTARTTPTPKFNQTVAFSTGTISKFSDSRDSSLNNISEEEMSNLETSSIPSSKQSNMTLVDASYLSPLLRKYFAEHEDKLVQRLQQTLNMKNSPRRSPRLLNRENKPILNNVQPAPRNIADESFGNETIITGPAFSAGRRKVREMVDNQSEGRGIVDNQSDSFNEKEMTSPVQPEMNSSSDMIISNSILQDVTNTVKRRRKSMHKEAIEETASPTLCRKSLEEKEKEEIDQMAKSMGINSPLLDDIFDENRKPVPKKSVKRSVRRTTMLPPELNRTLNETFGTSGNNSMVKNRRRSSRLEAMHVVPTTKSFKNPLEVKSNWTIFDQEKHNSNILNMINSANLQMLQKLPAIGPKTAFVLHSHRELHGPFTSLAILEEIPGIQKSFFNKFVKTHQIVL